ncbi:membrane-bound PQQ-dependent dehydrogenase (glucose/quinate/shikimate family) [Bradyrhizobium sp. JR3.5]
MQRSRAVFVTGIVYALIGLVLAGGGIWLAALGGSISYIVIGVGILATAALLLAQHRSALWLFAIVLVGTLAWAVYEVKFDWWPLAARGDIIFPMALWLLTPVIVRGLQRNEPVSYTRATAPLWVGVVAAAAVLMAGLLSSYHDINGTIAEAGPAVQQSEADPQPDGDWRAYGRTQFGQRYSPLKQITPDNVGNLKVAWTFRTGDVPTPEDSGETTFEVTPIKVRDTLYLCSQHQVLFALDAKTGTERWRYDPKLVHNKTFQHMTCRGVSYHETAQGAVDSGGSPAPAECPRRIFLPVNDGRMIALDADSGKLCDGFADHGILDLQQGMGIKTAGFFEPTSPPVVSDRILVVAAAVIDNYAVEVPSGVIRGFDVYTGKLVWAWDSAAADENALPSPTRHYTNGSPNSWITASFDPKLNLVYIPTGNNGPDIWGGNRDALVERYSSSIVALDVNTGKRAWSYQTVHHDLWDMDVPSQPSLVDVTTAKGVVPAIIQPTKVGNIFVLDRRTGELIVPAPERPVPQGPAPGDRSAPTQPFSELTIPAGSKADRRRHVGRHDLRPAAVPDHVPPLALRGHVHAALVAGHAGLPGQSRHVRMGRHRGRSCQADRHRQSDVAAFRLKTYSARPAESSGADRREAGRQRGRGAADVRHAVRGGYLELPLAALRAVLPTAMGFDGRHRSQDDEDRLAASERHDQGHHANTASVQDGRANARRPDHHRRRRRVLHRDL